MNNKFFRVITAIWKKIAVVFLGLILSLLLLEAGLRLGGFILSSMQEFGNLRSLKQKDAYRILCLGESTTQGQYPYLLEQILNKRHIGVRFSVIDKGRTGVHTPAILSRVESYLDEYHPDAVVAMMGINDKGVRYYKDILEPDTWLFRHCRVYRFGRILFVHILKKIRREDIFELDRSDSESKKGRSGSSSGLSRAKKLLGKDAGLDSGYGNTIREPGQLYLNQGKSSQVEDSFKKAIEINPKNDITYFELGCFYQDQDKYPQAEDAFKTVVDLNPKNDNAYTRLGQLYRVQCKFPQAEDVLKKAIELNPKSYAANYECGWVYLDQSKFPQAEDFFKKAIELHPEDHFLYAQLGWLYLNQNKFPQAEASFKKAIELHPEGHHLYNAISVFYEKMNKPELAKEYTQKANRLTSWYLNSVTVNNYRKLKSILDKREIRLICVQYPMRNVEPLKRMFENNEGIIFVDNENVFKKVLKEASYKEYFNDMFGGDFGHCTQKGNELLAQNIADVILREVFNK